jgi:hypothetical protein
MSSFDTNNKDRLLPFCYRLVLLSTKEQAPRGGLPMAARPAIAPPEPRLISGFSRFPRADCGFSSVSGGLCAKLAP